MSLCLKASNMRRQGEKKVCTYFYGPDSQLNNWAQLKYWAGRLVQSFGSVMVLFLNNWAGRLVQKVSSSGGPV